MPDPAQSVPSLRARILGLLMVLTAGFWAVTVWAIYSDAKSEADSLFDASLAQTARVMIGFIWHETEEGDSRGIEVRDPAMFQASRYEARVFAVVRDGEGNVLVRSPGAPVFPTTTAHGYRELRINGVVWRLFTLHDPRNGAVVQTAQRLAARERLAHNLVWDSFGPLLVLVPLLVLFILGAVGWGLGPLERLAREVGVRAPDMMEPVDPARAPQEVRPLFDAVNALLGRLSSALDRERRFTGDAAHELRTPLAALRTHAQVALRSRDDVQRARALTAMMGGVDRCSRLLEHLLTLTRMDARSAAVRTGHADLAEVARAAAGTMKAEAEGRHIVLAEELDGPCPVRGDAEVLEVLVRNLVENAVHHSPDGSTVTVRVSGGDVGAHLEVEDEGPGIPEAERARVFERFHRVAGAGADGSGLGLSIVARVADLHAARVLLGDRDRGRGLRATVVFPPVRSAGADRVARYGVG